MKKTALVTGAEGFIGSHMVRFLSGEGWNVIGGYRVQRQFVPKMKNVKFVQCDLTNGQRVGECFPKISTHARLPLRRAESSYRLMGRPVVTFESNIMGSLHVFEAIRHQKRLPIVVSACSSAEYGNVPASAIPVREEQPLRPCILTGSAKFVSTCWHANISWITKFRP